MRLSFEDMCAALVEFAREHGWDELDDCIDEAQERYNDDIDSGPSTDNHDDLEEWDELADEDTEQ